MRTPRATSLLASRTRWCAATIAAGLIGIAGCSSGNTSAPGAPASSTAPTPVSPSVPLAAAYHSPDGYSISPPDGWVLHPTTGQQGLSVVFAATTVDTAAHQPFVNNLNVVITPTTDTLDSLIAQDKQQSPGLLPHYTVVTDQAATLSKGRQAHLLGATYDQQGTGSLENIQLILVDAGKEYTITFTSPAESFDNYHDLAQASLASFTLD